MRVRPGWSSGLRRREHNKKKPTRRADDGFRRIESGALAGLSNPRADGPEPLAADFDVRTGRLVAAHAHDHLAQDRSLFSGVATRLFRSMDCLRHHHTIAANPFAG